MLTMLDIGIALSFPRRHTPADSDFIWQAIVQPDGYEKAVVGIADW